MKKNKIKNTLWWSYILLVFIMERNIKKIYDEEILPIFNTM